MSNVLSFIAVLNACRIAANTSLRASECRDFINGIFSRAGFHVMFFVVRVTGTGPKIKKRETSLWSPANFAAALRDVAEATFLGKFRFGLGISCFGFHVEL